MYLKRCETVAPVPVAPVKAFVYVPRRSYMCQVPAASGFDEPPTPRAATAARLGCTSALCEGEACSTLCTLRNFSVNYIVLQLYDEVVQIIVERLQVLLYWFQ